MDGRWRLAYLEIEVPEGVAPTPDRTRLEPLSRELLGLFSGGQYVALYERFAPELKDAWPAVKFQDDMSAFQERMGRVGDATLRGLEDLPEGYVAAVFDVAFAAGPAEARLKWLFRAGSWDLLGFAVKARD